MNPMSKVRIPINPMQVGRVGAYSMYVRNGEQIVRQRKNSSNYGEGASRTASQQTNRVKWSNLVNFWKVVSPFLKQAFYNKLQTQTDYNRFMQLNKPEARVNLKKQEAENDAVVADSFIMSEGTFSKVTDSLYMSGNTCWLSTNLKHSIEITQNLSWGQVSQNIIDNNSEWQDGDNIALLVLVKYTDPMNGFPHLTPHYYESTIDSTSTSPRSYFEIGDMLGNGETAGDEGYFACVCPGLTEATFGGAVMFHARRSGKLLVSGERLAVGSENVAPYITPEALAAAIASYGLDPAVVLDPI